MQKTVIAKVLNEHLPGDDDNELAKWMWERLGDKNFLRQKKALEYLGFDWVYVFPQEPIVDLGETPEGHKKLKDIWGMVQLVAQNTSEVFEKPIKSEKELYTYKCPKAADFDYYNIDLWVNDGFFAVGAQLDFGFSKISQLTGFEEYMEYLYSDPAGMHCLMERFIEFEIEMADRLIDSGVDCIWLADDFAYNNGPFISPAMVNEFVLKYMKIVVGHIHSRDIPVVHHCCGNLNDTIEMVIATGVNAIDAMQPTAHNDIYEYKKKYGKDICLIGNIDVNDLLPNGSPWQIDQKVKEMAEKLFYDRKGWILATCCILDDDVPVENAIAMHLAAERYGRLK